MASKWLVRSEVRRTLSDEATSEPRQSDPKEVVRARRSARAVGRRGTLGERKYLVSESRK